MQDGVAGNLRQQPEHQLDQLDGQLVLNEDDDMWPPEELARLSMPYQRSRLKVFR